MRREERVFSSRNRPKEALKYYWFSPLKTDACMPLVVDVHGAGGRGNQLSDMPNNTGLLGKLTDGKELKAYVAFPQCYCDTWYELFDVLLEFIDHVRQLPEVDTNRIYLMGGSMGGYTVWQLAMSRPDWFAAVVPICGGGMYWNAARLKDVPIWAFHGALDTVVLPEESIRMVNAVNRAGGHAKLTLLTNAAHNAWDPAVESDELIQWMFAQARVSAEPL